MKAIKVPARDEVSPESQLLFDEVAKKIGKLPNLCAAIGYSATTLKGFLAFDAAVTSGVFTLKEREAINLVVSEANDCGYCLAAHTVAAKNTGYSQEDTISLRQGISDKAKLSTIIRLAKSITENQGHADQALLDNFFSAGYKEDALIELVGLIAVRIFTNYVYAVTGVPVDFPEAISLK